MNADETVLNLCCSHPCNTMTALYSPCMFSRAGEVSDFILSTLTVVLVSSSAAGG